MKKRQFLTFTLLLTSVLLLPIKVATAQLEATLEGHTDNVWSVVFSPNGKMLASGSWDQTVRIWNVNTGQLLHTLTGHTDTVSGIAFSPDGNTLASASWDGTILLWNPRNGKLKRTLTGHAAGVSSVAFSLDGQTLASGSDDQTVRLWNPNNGKHIKTLKGHTYTVYSVVFSPEGDMIASGSGVVDVADLLLVIEHLDNPKDAAAPTRQEVVVLLNPAMLSGHLSILHAQNDGTLKYQQAIGFLESLLGAAYPERTLLHPNYPNPFNPETWIPYQLSEPAEVTLHIYAIDGALIQTLALGHQPAGMYQSKTRAAYWDGRNDVGERVGSGIYFYTLTTDDFSATRKMLILK